ncbi:MAG: LytTR family DNA-binding domain-containing protein, partial [Holophagales bacterium]|nr:LytTR family DNA-binding domain-containing protein [Holophagales bacterium]
LRVSVVDDEPLARRALLELLRRDPGAEVVGEYADGGAALDGIRANPPDVLLLDIQMPVMDGLEVARRLGAPPPLVVFVTAYDRYAVHAFRSLALDYLLKPCSEKDLRDVLERARRRLESDELAEVGRRILRLAEGTVDGEEVSAAGRGRDAGPEYLQRFTARKHNRTVMVQVEQIEWIEADDYCVRVHAAGACHVLRRSLKWFGERLDPDQFVRVHRSALINLAHLREIRHRGADDQTAILSSGAEVPLSRAGREAIREALPSL